MKIDKVYIAEAFAIAGAFISLKYFENNYDDIDILQSKFFLITQENKDWRFYPKTLDPSAWTDWMHAVKIILKQHDIHLEKTQITLTQSYFIMHEFIKTFAHTYNFLDIIKFSKDITLPHNFDPIHCLLWKQWLFCLSCLQKGQITTQTMPYSEHENIFSKEQSYQTMYRFFVHFCIAVKKMHALKMLLQKDMYPAWESVYQLFSNDQVNLLQSYDIMFIFFQKIAIKHLPPEIYQEYISMLAVNENQMPVDYDFLYHWIREANFILLQSFIE